MAQEAFTCFSSLTKKVFPLEFENVFRPRIQSLQQRAAAEKVLVAGADRRQRIVKNDTLSHGEEYPFVGLLRMEFNGTPFIGTASIVAKGSCLLTCAHNVVDYDDITKEFECPTSVWFELRKNEPGSGSSLIKRYEVTHTAVYPPYLKNPKSTSGYDLALCWIDVPEEDHTIKELYFNYLNHPDLVSGFYVGDSGTVAVVGFPGEHEGEKWGMAAQVPTNKHKDWNLIEKEILVYDFIDTSPGQSGSPIIVGDAYDILGVHTGGSATRGKNWGTYITSTKLSWIESTMGSKKPSGEFNINS